MLPDGAHRTEQDWTFFFLNRKVPDTVSSGGKLSDPVDGPPLYVINLVRNKAYKEARRGAIVKAIAIASVHQFIHVYKPVLLFAIEKYFQRNSVDVLASLYEAVNTLDLTHMPVLSPFERQILRCSEDREMFDEKFVDEDRLSASSLTLSATGGFGAPAELSEAMDLSGSGDFLSSSRKETRNTYIDLASGQRRGSLTRSKDRHFYGTKIYYEGIKIPIRVPMALFPEEVGDFSLIKLVSIFTPSSPQLFSHPYHPHLDSCGPNTPPIILLLNAMLTMKRIIFLGHGRASGEVCNCVLAACAMASGGGAVLRGFAERAFPYTNLTQVDTLLQFPGFIAGVTNPNFEEHPNWWDVCCNLTTGKITVSPNIAPAQIKSPAFAGAVGADGDDIEFMNEVMSAINSHLGEQAVRIKFQQYLQRFVRIAALYEDETVGATSIGFTSQNIGLPKVPEGISVAATARQLGTGLVITAETTKARELAGNAGRVEGWQETISYSHFKKDFLDFLKTRRITGIDIERQMAKFRLVRNMPEEEAKAIFLVLREGVVSPDDISEFLSYLPQNAGGLFPIALGLFHQSKTVQDAAAQILKRVSYHPTGARFIQHLNRFQRSAYERIANTLTQAKASSEADPRESS